MKYDNYIGLPYKNNGRDTSGIEFLEKSGVVVTKYET